MVRASLVARVARVPRKLWVCQTCRQHLRAILPGPLSRRNFQTDSQATATTPFRKQLKDEAKKQRLAERQKDEASRRAEKERIERWELTIGLEIHAQLNTDRKLFSRASAASIEAPNSQVSLFDVSMPGSQPEFQTATLLPALRAALALNCTIPPRSSFDRKHYFYPDQPAGYQITQYYSPFARDGHIRLDKHDGIAPEDGETITIGIKQIQMEQDTAKTVQQPPETSLLDFNRVGHPLIEIITLPQIHHPQTAAACVRKIQQVLQAVSSVTTGMELGGLRADVNVSVLPRGGALGTASYHGIQGLGTRTEIKNLSSFKAIEDAVIAERNRQITVLEGGGLVEGETRGWTLGSTETRKLRGKEGEVDYRYMPDPDLPPVLIGSSLLDHVYHSLPMLPDDQARILVTEHGLTMKDAKTLISLESGQRLDYFQNVLHELLARDGSSDNQQESGRMAGNWVLHELGGLLTKLECEFSNTDVPAASLATIISNLRNGDISGKTAKALLMRVFESPSKDVESIIEEDDLRIKQLSEEEYHSMASRIVEQFPDMARKVRDGQTGKTQWLIGQMIRQSNGRVDAQRAAAALAPLLQPPEG